MAVQASGDDLKLSEIQTEFGGSNPIQMSEYYRGGSYVPSGATDVPASGQMLLSDFYGTENYAPISATGGSTATSGDYKIVTFTSSGTP